MSLQMGKGMFGGIPKTAQQMANNQAIIAVLSASILAPMIAPPINNAVKNIPFVRDHQSLSSFVPAIALFGIAKKFTTNSLLSALIIGVAGSFVLTGIMPYVSPLLSRVRS
tara:strand:+ start:15 stop:347 length:333 start_codon:yes stop_codon:yes gene_type:complete